MIVLDYTDRRPLYEQIAERFQSLVLCGVLEKDAAVPSVRSLAMELSVNPNTIQRAYAELERRGILYTVSGKGNFVSDVETARKRQETEITEEIRELVKKAREAKMTPERLCELLRRDWNGGQ